MNRCGCNPIQQPFEFPIEDSQGSVGRKFKKLFPYLQNIQDLKEKIICEYSEIIDKLECGIQIDLEPLLRKISYVYIYGGDYINNKNFIYIPPITYIGFSLEKDFKKADTSTLIEKHLSSSIEMVQTINNELYGSYLWIISPYPLTKVATDEGFTYEVKMIPVGYENEMHYYRSSSRLDICNLTYYIK